MVKPFQCLRSILAISVDLLSFHFSYLFSNSFGCECSCFRLLAKRCLSLENLHYVQFIIILSVVLHISISNHLYFLKIN